MLKYRIIFSKTGRAVWISHLDTMHTLQRAFTRAGIKLAHSEGFNPHPLMSIALPLSVGMESICEVLDIKTEAEIDKDKLNSVLPEGIVILSVYQSDVKAAEIKWLEIEAQYNSPDDDRLNAVFKRDSLIINKKTKSGFSDVDIKPMIQSISFCAGKINAVISAQNPTLNPNNLIAVIDQLEPDIQIEDVKFRRIRLYKENMEEFK